MFQQISVTVQRQNLRQFRVFRFTLRFSGVCYVRSYVCINVIIIYVKEYLKNFNYALRYLLFTIHMYKASLLSTPAPPFCCTCS